VSDWQKDWQVNRKAFPDMSLDLLISSNYDRFFNFLYFPLQPLWEGMHLLL